jgi:hypothetical protein
VHRLGRLGSVPVSLAIGFELCQCLHCRTDDRVVTHNQYIEILTLLPDVDMLSTQVVQQSLPLGRAKTASNLIHQHL